MGQNKNNFIVCNLTCQILNLFFNGHKFEFF